MKPYGCIVLMIVAGSITQFGCKKSAISTDEPVNPMSRPVHEDMAGMVYLTTENNPNPWGGWSSDSVQVTIDGTSDSTMTNSGGYWKILDVPEGTYNLTFSKTGYGTTKLLHVRFRAGSQGLGEVVWLGQLPTFDISTVYTQTTDTTLTVRGGIIKAPGYRRNMYIYLGKTSNVSSSPSDYQLLYTAQTDMNRIYSVTIPLSDLRSGGFASGDTVFIAVYEIGGYSTMYADSATRRTIYPSLSTKSFNSFVVLP